MENKLLYVIVDDDGLVLFKNEDKEVVEKKQKESYPSFQLKTIKL